MLGHKFSLPFQHLAVQTQKKMQKPVKLKIQQGLKTFSDLHSSLASVQVWGGSDLEMILDLHYACLAIHHKITFVADLRAEKTRGTTF